MEVPTPEGNSISGPFVPEELVATLRCLKPAKSLASLRFYFPGVHTPQCGFVISSLPACANTKSPGSGEEY